MFCGALRSKPVYFDLCFLRIEITDLGNLSDRSRFEKTERKMNR